MDIFNRSDNFQINIDEYKIILNNMGCINPNLQSDEALIKESFFNILNPKDNKIDTYIKNQENEKLEKLELTSEKFNQFLTENKNNEGTTIVNLFIIEGDSGVTLSPRELSLEGGLGFEPLHDEKNPVLYFIQYLNYFLD